jgi:hypothetical protein
MSEHTTITGELSMLNEKLKRVPLSGPPSDLAGALAELAEMAKSVRKLEQTLTRALVTAARQVPMG